MNEQETRALHGMGREAWNEWASQVLKSKANFEEAGVFVLNWFGEAGSEQTELWLKFASAGFSNTRFEEKTDFDGFMFPGPVNFAGAVFEGPASFAGAEFQLAAKFGHTQFQRDASFKEAKFLGQAVFDDAVFDGAADFERAQFLKEKNGPLSHGAKFQRTRFLGKADFRSTVFAASADFSKVQFAGTSRFDEARLNADALFESAVFSAPAGFHACQFLENAVFKDAQFTGEARFAEAIFKGECYLDQSQFWGDASFRGASFEKDASFAAARIEGISRFTGAKFATKTNFADSKFKGYADFSAATFAGPSLFNSANFEQGGSWAGCHFADTATFSGVTLHKTSSFKSCQFVGPAAFDEAQFNAPVSFASSRFNSAADFSAIRSTVAFVLASADFIQVPSFHEASFNEPPRVDHMVVADPLKRFQRWKLMSSEDPRRGLFRLMKVTANSDASAKFRRLKKLAAEAHDLPREQEFFAQELRCRQFWHDTPIGPGMGRFWLGWIYGGVANFGRSMVRPLIIWLATIAVFALIFLVQRGPSGLTSPPANVLQPQLSGMLTVEKLSCVSGSSDRIGEAIYLSFRNAFWKLDWADLSTSRRVLGCLYGLDSGGNPLVPLGVSALSLFEAVISAALIFLFLLALRNLLKVR